MDEKTLKQQLGKCNSRAGRKEINLNNIKVRQKKYQGQN